jgi:hypothetical protein
MDFHPPDDMSVVAPYWPAAAHLLGHFQRGGDGLDRIEE